MNQQDEIIVRPIPTSDAKPWIVRRHYAKRMCPISYAY